MQAEHRRADAHGVREGTVRRDRAAGDAATSRCGQAGRQSRARQRVLAPDGRRAGGAQLRGNASDRAPVSRRGHPRPLGGRLRLVPGPADRIVALQPRRIHAGNRAESPRRARARQAVRLCGAGPGSDGRRVTGTAGLPAGPLTERHRHGG